MKQDREAYAEAHRAERVSHLNDLAARYREKAEAARQAAKVARWRSFRSQEAAFHRANAQSLLDQAARFEAEARAIETDAAAMGLVEVRPGYDWARLNSDVEPLAPHAVSSGDRSALTGTDHPPSIDRTRVYGVRHGLRAPLAQHQVELENAMPRDAGGTPVRGADPRSPYFKLVNDGGPAMDPTRGINCQDCVLSFFETYVHGRPRVSAPRTFDAYQDGDPDQPSGGEQWGTERAELVTGGRFQSLCDDVSREHPVVAKRKVDQAFADIERQLRAGGPGSFAFIVNAWESGSAHAWCAINQGGQILFVDPQVGDVAGAGMPGRVPTLYGHSGVPRRSNVVRIDALVVNSQGVAMDFANAPDGAWHVQNKTLPPLPPPPVPPSLSTAPDSGAHPVATSVSSPVPAPSVNSVSPAPGLDRSTSAPGPQLDLDAPHPAPQLNLSTPSPKPRLDLSTPPPAPRSDFGPPSAAVEADRSPASSPAEPSHPSPPPGPPVDRIARALDAGPLMALSKPRVRSTDGYDAAMRKGYFGYQRHAREHHEQTRRDELTSHLNTRAENCLSDAAVLDSQARQALRDGWMMRAERLAAGARDVRQSADSLRYGAERVRSGDHVPDRVDVDGPDWARINDDVGALAIGPVETGDRSGITDDVPPSIDHSRRYGVRGGLRVPLAMHQTDLERAMPRDAGGRPVRHADPRLGDWFGLANDGGPEADPTRGINCVDGVLALFDTYMHGRPRVSAPRTFDAYAYGDTNRPLDAEAGGLARIENTVRGEFQGMCPYVGDIDHAEAAQAVDTAMTNLTNHLHNLGHGAFAFIVTDSEGGPAHAWCAVNQNGTILFLDPQTRRISENAPLYRNHGVPSEGNIVSMDALVVNGRGEYAALPYHKAGLWSRSSLEPT
ncbi:MAG TPA: toxin glutamine deamidase domain-containing protein, partial [Euzebyales bacterium]|nr:toxin glutamine deamidase domain-containing protein [Euzebyales bacterium]